MAVEAVGQFFQAVAGDQSLQAELLQAMQAENDREAVTQLGNEKGYDFTSDELWAEVQKRQAEFEKRREAGELTDEELELIAGGLTPGSPFVFLITLAATVGTIVVAGTIGATVHQSTGGAVW